MRTYVGLFPGGITADTTKWISAFQKVNGGDASDPKKGVYYNGDVLSTLGLQFGTNAEPQISVYLERAFQQVGGQSNVGQPSKCGGDVRVVASQTLVKVWRVHACV